MREVRSIAGDRFPPVTCFDYLESNRGLGIVALYPRVVFIQNNMTTTFKSLTHSRKKKFDPRNVNLRHATSDLVIEEVVQTNYAILGDFS